MRTFTLSQAQQLIPRLQEEMTLLRPAYQTLKQLWEAAASGQGLEVDDPEVRSVCLQDPRAQDALDQVEASLTKFQKLGVECRAIEDGIFDFPCLVNDRFVYLCWQIDEQEVDHWHEVDADFEGRQPLFELARANSEPAEMLLN